MPLTNEGDLRASLDSLFYKDTIMSKLKKIGVSKLAGFFPKESPSEPEPDYLSRMYKFISDKFGGYSIGHFQGRFRADDLKTFQEVSEIQQSSGRYIIDETTAIVKFIFPCGEPIEKNESSVFGELFDDFEVNPIEDVVKNEALRITKFFYLLFVDSILQIVNGEDEIWMLESGIRSRLHIFRAK